jgi:hypothetical protein
MSTINPFEKDVPELEIVGLHHNSNGRSCCQHNCCGAYVEEGDVLRLVHVVVQIRAGSPPEDAIKLVKIMDGVEGCCVGFVPRAFAQIQRIKDKVGCCVIVLELYDNSPNSFKRRMSKRNYGVASCVFLDSIPSYES